MKHRVTRRQAFGGIGALLGSFVAPNATMHAQSSGAVVPAGFPISDPEVVRTLVTVAHSDLQEVRRLVERQPALARASWDWGYGDWEVADPEILLTAGRA